MALCPSKQGKRISPLTGSIPVTEALGLTPEKHPCAHILVHDRIKNWMHPEIGS